MKLFLRILVLVCLACAPAWGQPQNAAAQSSPKPASPPPPASAALAAPEDEDTRKAKALVQQAIQALGGQAYLTVRDREQNGRIYGFHHGRQSGEGALFWSFSEFPDKERVELTKERDIAELFVGDKGYEITYKGVHAIEQKDLDDYLRRRHFSLDTVLRTWVNDPGVIFLYEGFAVAAQHPSEQVKLINARDEAVTLDFDSQSHLPVKKSFWWRDPVDRQRNVEDEVYENYKPISGVMVPQNVTRFFNGDMSNQRFIFSATINQGLDPAMFDPNSGYDPNKPAKKR